MNQTVMAAIKGWAGSKLGAVVLAGAGALGATEVVRLAENQTKELHACIDHQGHVTMLDAGQNTACKANEVEVTWNTKGPHGQQGPQGLAGPQGPQGPAGADGAPGPAGRDGSDGAPGSQGLQGPQGSQGLQGTAGKDGAPGPQGALGPAGPAGAPGDPGSNGITKLQNLDGVPCGSNPLLISKLLTQVAADGSVSLYCGVAQSGAVAPPPPPPVAPVLVSAFTPASGSLPVGAKLIGTIQISNPSDDDISLENYVFQGFDLPTPGNVGFTQGPSYHVPAHSSASFTFNFGVSMDANSDEPFGSTPVSLHFSATEVDLVNGVSKQFDAWAHYTPQ